MCVLAPYPDPAHVYRDLSHAASLSRPFDAAERPPRLFHSLRQERNSVLSLAADSSHLFSGGPTGDISVSPPHPRLSLPAEWSLQVWCKDTLKLKNILRGHTGSILALEYAADKEWLFSASGASTPRSHHPRWCPQYVYALQVTAQFAYVCLAFASCSVPHRIPCQVWSTRTLSPLFLINPHGETDAGDLFSLVWCPTLQTLYFGCQDTSLQWFTFPSPSQPNAASSVHFITDDPSSSGRSTPTSARRAHKFFDSYPQYQRRPADLLARNPTCSTAHAQQNVHAHGVSLPPTPPSSSSSLPSTSSSPPREASPHRPLAVLQVPPCNVIYSAHYGYIYCMALVPSVREGSDDPPFDSTSERQDLQLVTGSGDESVKVRHCPSPLLTRTR